jgi:NADPH2:quinone reductase
MVVSGFGRLEVLTEAELPDPKPGPGQIAIATSHAAIGLIDVLLRRGDMRDNPGLPQPPYVPGGEVAGTVREIGEGVKGFHVGEPVVSTSQVTVGGYAGITLAQAQALTVVPLGDYVVHPAQAVAALPYAVTVYLGLTRAAHLEPRESVLVHGAAGGGLAATVPAVARSLGATRVFGTVSSAGRVKDTAHLGYDDVFTSDGFVKALAGQPVDVVADSVRGDVRTASLDVLAPFGGILLLGHAALTPDTPVTGDRLWLNSLSLVGFTITTYLQTHPGSARAAAEQVLPLIASGELALLIDELPLARAAEAHQRLENRLAPGRHVLAV